MPETRAGSAGRAGQRGVGAGGVGGDADERVLYLKRPALDFRERVTLEQRRRYYAVARSRPRVASGRDAP